MTTAWPSAASVGASTTASTSASAMLNSPKRAAASSGAERDRERQADPQEPEWHGELLAQLPELDPRGVREQDDGQCRLRQRADRLVRRRSGHSVDALRAHQHAGEHEDDRWCDRRAGEETRHTRDGEHGECDPYECPGHARMLARSGGRPGLRSGLSAAMDERLGRLLPIVGWLPRYQRRWLRGDLAAGIAVTALVVPKNLGYADIAGVPRRERALRGGGGRDHLRALLHLAAHLHGTELVARRGRRGRGARDRARRCASGPARGGDHARHGRACSSCSPCSGWAGSRSSSRRPWSPASSPVRLST